MSLSNLFGGPQNAQPDPDHHDDEDPPIDVTEEEDEEEDEEGEEEDVVYDEQPTSCDELDSRLKSIHESMKQEFKEVNQSLRDASIHLAHQQPKKCSSDPGSPRSSFSVEYDDNGQPTRKFDTLVYDEDREFGGFDSDIEDSLGWSKHKKHRFRSCLWRLKYNRIVTAFYLNDLRKNEEYWSWLMIVISTVTTGITVANNVEEEPIPYYHITINIMLNVSSMSTALIAAWIKKKQFVEKINEMDKYLIGINQLCEELEINMALLEGDRLPYEDFKTKYIPLIIKYASNNPMIPPDLWKKSVRDITINYPELVDPDSSEVNKLWPWFGDLVECKDNNNDMTYHIRKPTSFMKHMKKTNNVTSCCRKKKDCENVYK